MYVAYSRSVDLHANSVIVQTSSACRDLLLIQQLNKQQILVMRSLSALLPPIPCRRYGYDVLRLLSALHCSDHDSKKQVNSIRIIIIIDEKNIKKLTSKQPKCLITLFRTENIQNTVRLYAYWPLKTFEKTYSLHLLLLKSCKKYPKYSMNLQLHRSHAVIITHFTRTHAH